MAVERGSLLLADITGYTRYLSGVELEHSHDILADLLSRVVRHLQASLQLAKLEGDAVFCYAPDSPVGLDGDALMTLVEGCYFAFEERTRNIKNLSTCDCNACTLIPALTVKFLVHHGQYVLHEVVGQRELVGPDVVIAHRLLKNAVTERTGLRGYALFTRACLDRFGLDPAVLGMIPHGESYADVGEVEAWVHDLEARWREEQERRVVRLQRGANLIEIDVDLPGSPPTIWEWVTSPSKRSVWQPDTVAVERITAGTPGVGTTNHCVHGDGSVVREEILDWKPFRYFTWRWRAGFGEGMSMVELTPVDAETTHLSFRLDIMDPEERASFLPKVPDMKAVWTRAMERIARLMQAPVPSA